MSAEKKYTERDLVLAKRSAYARGVNKMYCHDVVPRGPGKYADAYDEVLALTNTAYPLPKVERPRVVRDPELRGYAWRSVAGRLETRTGGDSYPWTEDRVWQPTPERVALWADLLAHPTELVDDDGAEDGV